MNTIPVELLCQDNYIFTKDVPIPVDCTCSACTATANRDLGSLDNIEAAA